MIQIYTALSVFQWEAISCSKDLFSDCFKSRRQPRGKFWECRYSPQLIAKEAPCCGLISQSADTWSRKGSVSFGQGCDSKPCSVEQSLGISPLLAKVPVRPCKLKPWNCRCLGLCGMSPSGTVAGCHLQHLFTWQLCPDTDFSAVLLSHTMSSVPAARTGMGWACGKRGML